MRFNSFEESKFTYLSNWQEVIDVNADVLKNQNLHISQTEMEQG